MRTASSLLLTLTLSQSIAWGQALYSVTDIGLMPGKPESWATATNDSGIVVGFGMDGGRSAPYQGFQWNNGVFTYLGNLGGGTSIAWDINNAGQIVGESPTPDAVPRAFIREPGYPIRILTPFPTGAYGVAYAVSTDGRAAGVSEIQASYLNTNPRTGELYWAGRRATLWNPNGPTANMPPINLGVLPGGDFSIAFGVNRNEVALGQAITPNGFRAFYWTQATGIQQLPDVPQTIESGGRKINDNGVGTVIYGLPGGAQTYLWSVSGTLTPLANCAGFANSFPNGINQTAQVVGSCRNAPGTEVASVSIGNAMRDLNTLLDASGSGWVLKEAWGVDNQGRIVGMGLRFGVPHAFRASPLTVPATIQLNSSTGAGLQGGVASYLDGNNVWQTVGTTGPGGSLSAQVPQGTIQLKMTYNGTSQIKTQDASTPFVFTTTSVQLQFSDSIEYDTGAGFVTFTKPAMELLPGNVNFRFGAAGTATIPVSGTLVRKTIAAERLLSSAGTVLPGGSGRYYVNSWQPCLGPGNPGYVICMFDNFVASATFSIDYAYTTNQKSQNISADSYVVFQTTRVRMQLKDSFGNALDPGTARYYAGAWRDAGITAGGETSLELLPGNYPFTMTYASGQQQKSQNVAANPVVVFQTVNATLEMRDSSNNLVDTGTALYYAGAWLPFGTTSGGIARKELLPASYPFRMTFNSTEQQLSQDVGANPVVTFRTSAITVQLKDSNGNPLDTGTVQYYAGSWLNFGATAGGQTTRELLPGTYSFRMTYASSSQQINQNVAANPVVVFQTRAVVLRLIDSQGNTLDTGTAQYYANAWLPFGTTSGGQVTKQLLPGAYPFTMAYASGTQQKSQDIGVNPTVIFQTGQVNSASNTCSGYYAGAWLTFINGMELLPGSYVFRFSDSTPNTAFAISPAVVNTIH